RFDRTSERVTAIAGFGLGHPDDRVHGLAVSRRHPGLVWATLEHANAFVLVDPRPDRMTAAPRIVRHIGLPPGASGPHYIGEYGDTLWVSLKASNQVLRISASRPRDRALFDTPPDPIFVARHPVNGAFYASIDVSSKIMRM